MLLITTHITTILIITIMVLIAIILAITSILIMEELVLMYQISLELNKIIIIVIRNQIIKIINIKITIIINFLVTRTSCHWRDHNNLIIHSCQISLWVPLNITIIIRIEIVLMIRIKFNTVVITNHNYPPHQRLIIIVFILLHIVKIN